MPTVFISYARNDIEVARRLYNDLKKENITPWMDKEDILVGQEWEYEVEKAINNCSYILLLLSDNSVSKRGFVQKELKMALELYDRRPPSEIFLLPAIIDDCEPKDKRLQKIHRADFITSYEEGLRDLLKAIGVEAKEPSDETAIEKDSLAKEEPLISETIFEENKIAAELKEPVTESEKLPEKEMETNCEVSDVELQKVETEAELIELTDIIEEPLNRHPEEKNRKWKIAALFLAVLTVLLIGTYYLYLSETKKIPGKLYVDTTPLNANVKILNSNLKFQSGMEIAPGLYQVEVSAYGYQTGYKSASIAAGQNGQLDILLKPVEIASYTGGFDISAVRRVNIKCPVRISYGQNHIGFNKESLSRALFIYRNIDDNVKDSTSDEGKVYSFTDNPRDTSRKYFIVYAKASFNRGELHSLSPKTDLVFLDVFYVTEIDFEQNWITLKKQKDRTQFKIGIGDFEKAFIWYSELLDTDRVYIPVYGFLGVPFEAYKPPDIYRSWRGERETWLAYFDFYRILDYKDGYYLLAEDINSYSCGHIGKKTGYGIIGWVQEKYIVLWRSRLYHRPLQEVEVYDVKNFNPPDRMTVYDKTDKINQFYLRQDYPDRQEIEQRLRSKTFVNLDRFYRNFGFPDLYPPYATKGSNYVKVAILEAFSSKLMAELVKEINGNINAFFLIDTSVSMEKFKDFISSFQNRINVMGYGINKFRIYAYNDSIYENEDFYFESSNNADNLVFGKNTWRPEYEGNPDYKRDIDYKEPLMGAFSRSLDEIEALNLSEFHINLLFIITDAGANDYTPQLMGKVVNRVKEQGLRVFFIIPDNHGSEYYQGKTDTPESAYNYLIGIIDGFKNSDPKFFKNFVLSTSGLTQKESNVFNAKYEEIFQEIEKQLNIIFHETDTHTEYTGAIFSPNISRGAEVTSQFNYVIKYIDPVGNPEAWEQRITIPKNVIDIYIYRKAQADSDVKLEDLKKLIIVNSFMSVHSIIKCREVYYHLNKILKLETNYNLDGLFYKALTGRNAGKGIRWKYSLTRGMLRDFGEQRIFYLNQIKESTSHQYTYLKLSELIDY